MKNGKQKFIKTIQLVALIAIIETITQINLKNGTFKDNKTYLLYGMIGYCFIAYVLWINFTFDGMGQVNLLWNCMTTITAFVAGYIIFNESMNRYTYYSIMFAVLAIYFSYLSDVETEE